MVEQIWLHRGTIQLSLVLILFFVSLFRGGLPEIFISAYMLSVQVVDRIYHHFDSNGSAIIRYSDGTELDYGHLLFDVIGMVFFLILALRSNRIYTLWISGWQIICLVAHFSRSIMPHLHHMAYVTMEQAPYLLQILALMAGLVAEICRRQSGRTYRYWRSWLPQKVDLTHEQ